MKQKFLSILVIVSVSVSAWAQIPHWQYNPHDFEYDMTAYVSLKYYPNLSNYEIAAFCGEECRGVAEIMDADKRQVGYLRIRSNASSGEAITFKVFIKDRQEEVNLDSDPVSFAANTTLGTPSRPFLVQIPGAYLPGDVNGDGDIDIVDVTSTIGYVIHQVPADFIFKAADVNNDGTVDIVDVTSIIDMIINKGKNVKKLNIEDAGNDPQ